MDIQRIAWNSARAASISGYRKRLQLRNSCRSSSLTRALSTCAGQPASHLCRAIRCSGARVDIPRSQYLNSRAANLPLRQRRRHLASRARPAGTDSKFPGFVAEIESDGSAHLRFGDGTYGAAPDPNLAFTATYRTGNGAAGNVGREALAHVLFTGLGITGVRNPLGAAGGVDPETADHIQQVAPFSFESQLRCVAADDYGTMAETLPGVREAKGTIRWTGSWYTAFTSIDPAQTPLSSALESSVRSSLNTMRMMGTDLVVEGAVFVGLRIGLDICVAASQFRGDVYAAVLRVLVTGDRCSGTLGLLDPANFEFGETVYASPVVAAAQSVPGVVALTLTTFERMDSPTPPGMATPIQLTMGRLEIPRCDNDPNHADRGLLILSLDGGK